MTKDYSLFRIPNESHDQEHLELDQEPFSN